MLNKKAGALLDLKAHTKSFWRDLACLTLFLSGMFTFLLGHRPLATPDEGRYVEISREMLASSEFITPHLNGLPYFEKPPLFYWLESFLVACFGPHNTFGLRLSTSFFALLGCLSLFLFAYRSLGRKTALWASVVLSTSLLYVFLARLLILDLVFTVFMTTGLLSFWQSTQSPSPRRAGLWSSAYGASLAGAVLTKGLVGVLLPGLVILLWIAWTRQGALLKKAFHPLTLLVFTLIALPWHLAVSLKNPEFPYFYFIHEHFLRYTTTVHRRQQAFWFFAPVLLVGFFPWSPFLPTFWRAHRKRLLSVPDHLSSFLFLWASVVFLFFSFSSSKLIPYLLPAFPPLALLVGTGIGQAPEEASPGFRIYAIFAFLMGLALVLYIPFERFFSKGQPDIAALWPGLALGVLSLWSGTAWVFYRGMPSIRRFQGIALSTLFFLGAAAYIDPWVQPRPSIGPLAEKLKPLLKDHTPVIVCGFYLQDLPVYLERPVQVFAYRGELDFGASIRPKQDRLLTNAAFGAIWAGEERAFAVLPYRGENVWEMHTSLQLLYPHLSFYVLSVQPPYLLCTNHSPTEFLS